MTVVTVSRELGSGGNQVVDLLCERLGYCRVDKTMLSEIAAEAGVDVKAVLTKERDVAAKPRLISDQMTSLYSRQPAAFGQGRGMDDQTYQRIVRETMQKYAREEDAVIVGRGGQIILRDWPNTLHVHLYAAPEQRVQNLIARYGITKLDAQRRIERSDEQKRLYIRNLHKNANWKDLKYYHLAIDSGRIPAKAVVELVVTAANAIAPG